MRNIKQNKVKVNIWALRLVFVIFIVILAHYLFAYRSIGNSGYIYYVGYMSWMLLFCLNFARGKQYKVEKKWLYIYIILFINEVIAMEFGEVYFSNAFKNFHRIIFFILAIYVSFNIDWKTYISFKDVLFILKFIVFLGVLVSVFAMIDSRETVIHILKGQNASLYKWLYKGIFSHRNIFAEFLFLCMVASVWVYFMTNKKRYILYSGLLFLQIYFTDSRSSVFAVIILILFALYLRKNNKTIICIGLLVILIYLFIIKDISISTIYSQFILENQHMTSLGIDSGQIRLQIWWLGIEKLIKSGALITGFCSGSSSVFLFDINNYTFGSFHNVYIDILFEGGIIKLTIYLYLLYCICKSLVSCKYKKIIIASLLAYCFHSCFESGAMLFSSNNNAVLATILFAIIPQGLEDV